MERVINRSMPCREELGSEVLAGRSSTPDYYDDPVSLWQRKHLRGDLLRRSTKEREEERTGGGAVSLRRPAHSAASVPYGVLWWLTWKPGIPTEVVVLLQLNYILG